MPASLKVEIFSLIEQIGDKKDAEKALKGLMEVLVANGRKVEPFMVKAFPKVVEALGDKSKAVQSTALSLANAIVEGMSPYALGLIMPALLAGIGIKAKPPQKVATLQLIANIAAKMPQSIGFELVNLAMPVAELT